MRVWIGRDPLFSQERILPLVVLPHFAALAFCARLTRTLLPDGCHNFQFYTSRALCSPIREESGLWTPEFMPYTHMHTHTHIYLYVRALVSRKCLLDVSFWRSPHPGTNALSRFRAPMDFVANATSFGILPTTTHICTYMQSMYISRLGSGTFTRSIEWLLHFRLTDWLTFLPHLVSRVNGTLIKCRQTSRDFRIFR